MSPGHHARTILLQSQVPCMVLSDSTGLDITVASGGSSRNSHQAVPHNPHVSMSASFHSAQTVPSASLSFLFSHHILDHHSGSCPAHMAMGGGGGLSSVCNPSCTTAISLAFLFCFIYLFIHFWFFFYGKKVSLYDLDWLGTLQTRMILRCSCIILESLGINRPGPPHPIL